MGFDQFRRTIQVHRPGVSPGQTIFLGEIPYHVIHVDGEIATCQEYTNGEFVHLQNWLLAWSKAVRVVEEGE